MPEGDTIHRTAATLRRALLGRHLTRLEAPRLPRAMPPPGTTVEGVEARGKHLLVAFDDGHVLHSHMRMTGSWHVYPARERWRRPRRRMRAVLADDEMQAVCFDAPVVELLDAAAVDRHPALRRLGPDLCLPGADLDAALDRMGRIPEPDRILVEVLLDQRVAAGIGNVFASELAFLARRHPLDRLDAVDVATRRVLLEDATRLLRANLERARRTTVPGAPDGSLWVYGRDWQPCRRCGTSIRVARVGDGARPTYWCPRCQASTGD
jgi:endonuclease-8